MRENDSKFVLCLIGPKGSGKTTLGGMIEEEFKVPFLKIEAIFKCLLSSGSYKVTDREYAEAGFKLVEIEIDQTLTEHSGVSFEITAASPPSLELLERLRDKYRVLLIKVAASAVTCKERIRSRSNKEQIQVSEEIIDKIYALSSSLKLPWNLEIVNDPPIERLQLVEQLSGLIHPLGKRSSVAK